MVRALFKLCTSNDSCQTRQIFIAKMIEIGKTLDAFCTFDLVTLIIEVLMMLPLKSMVLELIRRH